MNYILLKNIGLKIKKLIITFLFVFSIFNVTFTQEYINTYNKALEYANQGNIKEAEKYLKLTLSEIEKTKGKTSRDYLIVLKDLTYLNNITGDLEAGKKYIKEAYELSKNVLRNEDKELYATILNNYGYFLYVEGNYTEAEPIFKEALEIYRQLYNTDNPELATSINNMASFYNNIGNYKEAEKLYKEALEMRKRLFNGDNPDLANSLNSMGYFYHIQGNYTEAEKFYKEALEMRRRLFKGDHPDLARSLNNMASFYNEKGNFSIAESYYLEALEMRRRLFKSDHPDLATTINNLASFYDDMGNYEKAESLYKEALEMFRRLFKNDHPDLAKSINNLALFYNETGNYKDAEILYKEALEMRRRLFKSDHPDLLSSINNMAVFYNERGNHTAAEPLYKEALEMSKRLFKGDHPDVARSINNMASFYNDIGKQKDAEILYKEALEMNRRIFKEDNLELAKSINNMAYFYNYIGNYKEAEPLYKEALEMRRRLFKGDHPDLARSINNMAYFYDKTGNYTEAENYYKEALEMFRRLFKSDHPDLANSLLNFSAFYFQQGNYNKAENLFTEALDIYKRIFLNYTASLSEKERELFLKTFLFNFEIFNSFAIDRYTSNPKILCVMYNNLLFSKAILLNTSRKINERILNSGNDKLIAKFRTWKDTKEFLLKLNKMTDYELKEKNINYDSIKAIANQLEKELSKESEIYATELESRDIKWEDVRAKLKDDESAIEIVRFRYYDKNRWTDTIYYAALIVTKDTKENPKLILIENGNELETGYITKYREMVRGKLHSEDMPNIYEAFWGKISEELAGKRRIYLSPDGVYNQINLMTLYNGRNKRLLMDEQEIVIIPNTKDIALESKKKPSENKAELFGYPMYDIDKKEQEKISRDIRSNRSYSDISRDIITMKLNLLPGTLEEVKNIETIFKRRKIKSIIHTEKQALEETIKRVKNPKVLHIATHGYFMKDVEIDKSDERGMMMMGMERKRVFDNPMLRSMLFFTGANNTLKGEKIEGMDDGILTAAEAMNIELDNTELVVLSACETGLGEVRNGEGVMGLPRAFIQAGARSVIMSLWTIDDRVTKEWMTKFYERWLNGSNVREAYKETMKEIKRKYPAIYYWGAFVLIEKR